MQINPNAKITGEAYIDFPFHNFKYLVSLDRQFCDNQKSELKWERNLSKRIHETTEPHW